MKKSEKTAEKSLNYQKTTITCACGNTLEVGSTLDNIQVEICSACHPFFTGKTKLVDTAHRVHRFESLRQKSASLQQSKKKKTKSAAKKSATAEKSAAKKIASAGPVEQ